MANIVRRREQRPVFQSFFDSWEPFRLMNELVGWESHDTHRPVARFTPGSGLVPSFDIKETKEAYLIQADLPGFKEADLEISLTGDRLTVGGKRERQERQEDETYYSMERSYGSFSRTFTLPDGVQGDKVKAELKDGVLGLTLPKKPEVKSKRIAIKAS